MFVGTILFDRNLCDLEVKANAIAPGHIVYCGNVKNQSKKGEIEIP